MRVWIPAVLSLATLAFASSAHALEYEVGVRPAIGGTGSKSPTRYNNGPVINNQNVPTDSIFAGQSSPYDAGFVGQVSLGVKLLPMLSLGLAGDYRWVGASTPADVKDLSRNEWTLGPYAHVYFPLEMTKLVPWLGVGIQYMHDSQEFTTGAGKEKITTDAIGLPITVGALYPIFSHYLQVGPSFTYAPIFPTGGCVSGQGFEYCENDPSDRNITMVRSFGTWTLGLDITATFP